MSNGKVRDSTEVPRCLLTLVGVMAWRGLSISFLFVQGLCVHKVIHVVYFLLAGSILF